MYQKNFQTAKKRSIEEEKNGGFVPEDTFVEKHIIEDLTVYPSNIDFPLQFFTMLS